MRSHLVASCRLNSWISDGEAFGLRMAQILGRSAPGCYCIRWNLEKLYKINRYNWYNFPKQS
ncbi:hypothetical protein RSAG8_09000, partial [Rhizoctonia solani AG-8 WAC10335]